MEERNLAHQYSRPSYLLSWQPQYECRTNGDSARCSAILAGGAGANVGPAGGGGAGAGEPGAPTIAFEGPPAGSSLFVSSKAAAPLLGGPSSSALGGVNSSASNPSAPTGTTTATPSITSVNWTEVVRYGSDDNGCVEKFQVGCGVLAASGTGVTKKCCAYASGVDAGINITIYNFTCAGSVCQPPVTRANGPGVGDVGGREGEGGGGGGGAAGGGSVTSSVSGGGTSSPPTPRVAAEGPGK